MSSPKHTSLKTEPKQSKPVPRAAQVEESEWDSSDTDFSKEKLGTGKSFSVAAGTHSGDYHLIGFITVIKYTNVSVKEVAHPNTKICINYFSNQMNWDNSYLVIHFFGLK